MEKLLWELLKPGDGVLLTYVISGQGEHCGEKPHVTGRPRPSARARSAPELPASRRPTTERS